MSAALTLLGHIGKSHRRMAALAEGLDWEGVAGEWRSIYPEIAELRQIPLDRLTGAERAEVARRIAELLEFEKRISARITPWMEQVRPLLETFRKHPLKGQGV
ncbi:MAG: flagellar protein FliT [Candidatus Accumulibacter sp.]|jgi:hypothetical protein|nr:flagellar protein FliT [Accumulibacter sp.]